MHRNVKLQAQGRRSALPALLTLLGLAAVLLAVTAPLATAAKPGPPTPGFNQCIPIRGPQWVFPTDTYNRSDLFDASITSNLYESFTVNVPCAQAAAYIKQVIAQTLAVTTPGVFSKLTLGPGFSCIAYPDKNGHAYAGSCVSGSAKFDWNYNVMWHGVPGSSTGEGGLGVEPMGTIEYTTVVRPKGDGQYELEVTNSSAIGSIDTFTWNAPPGLTITAVTSSKGASCSQSGNAISCQGSLKPPQCLCTGSGGSAVIEFTATGDTPTTSGGHIVIPGFGWTYMRISKMTPVPYLIPDTPQTANPKKNV